MAATANFGWTKPTVNADSGTWGTILNAALDATDADLFNTATKMVNNAQTASYTLVLTDAGKRVSMNVASANNLTIPLNATVAFPLDTAILIYQRGAGQTTVVATGGVTIRSTGSKLKLFGQYSAGLLIKVATDEWDLIGDLTT